MLIAAGAAALLAPAAQAATTPSTADSWSGYADYAGNVTYTPFTLVKGKWVQPALNCVITPSAYAAFWVGFDGFATNSSTIEQVGTTGVCQAGTAIYYSWWQMAPGGQMRNLSFTITPGDTISASVKFTGTRYVLALTDAAHPENDISTRQVCPKGSTCQRSSAEWIAEAPTVGGGQTQLADFTSWRLTGAQATAGTLGTISGFPNYEITMTNAANKPLAAPGALNPAGNAFTVKWKRSQ